MQRVQRTESALGTLRSNPGCSSKTCSWWPERSLNEPCFMHSWKQSFYSRANICSATFIKENRSLHHSQHTFEWVYCTCPVARKRCDWRRLSLPSVTFCCRCVWGRRCCWWCRGQIISVPQSSEWPAALTLVICCVISAWPRNTASKHDGSCCCGLWSLDLSGPIRTVFSHVFPPLSRVTPTAVGWKFFRDVDSQASF